MSFTVCSFNCNGIRAAHRKGLLAWLDENRPDLLLLQEVRAWPDQVPPEVRCPVGYNSRWVNAVRKGYAGVALYSRVPVDRVVVGTGHEWADDEGRVLRVDVGGWTFASVYVPSGSASEERRARKVPHRPPRWGGRAGRRAGGRPTRVGADWNIAHTELDIWNPKGNAKNSGFLPQERAWVDRVLASGWVDVHRALHPGEGGVYSWWSNRGKARAKDRGWRLDYLLAANGAEERAEQSWVDPRKDLSDHAPVWGRFAGELYREGRLGPF